MRFPALILALACGLCLAAVGCVQPESPVPVAAPNPFGVPGYCPPGCCPPGYQCPPGFQCQPGCPCQPGYPGQPNQCPPGGCPQSAGEVGVQIGVTPPYPVNPLAQNEVKGDAKSDPAGDPAGDGGADAVKEAGCLPCQIHGTQPNALPQYQRPTASPPQAKATSKASPADEVKEGRFACDRCKKPTVGRDWQEIWSDDGLSILCMCKACYRTATPMQREVTLRNYLARSGIDTKTRPMVESAVIEAIRGY